MIEQEVPLCVATTVTQQVIIKFFTTESVKSSKILRRLKAHFGNNTLKIQVYTWQTIFRKTRNSWKWRSPTSVSAIKVLATLFFYFKGVLYIDFLHECRIVNSAYYCLLNETKLAYCRKRREFPIVILLHDNVQPYTAAQTRQKIENLWTTLEHLSDLSPCDYHLFVLLKEAFGGHRLITMLEAFLRNLFVSQPPLFYGSGIKNYCIIVICWEIYISNPEIM